MIFVTVGTHEQQFNRLVHAMDEMKQFGAITEEVIIQTGYSTYTPQFCQWSAFYPYTQMLNYVKDARIIISHGGPSSFIMPLQIGKIPIVVPRKKEFGEHINNHQVEFCRAVSERQGTILVIEEIGKLMNCIQEYDANISAISMETDSRNTTFCSALASIVAQL